MVVSGGEWASRCGEWASGRVNGCDEWASGRVGHASLKSQLVNFMGPLSHSLALLKNSRLIGAPPPISTTPVRQ